MLERLYQNHVLSNLVFLLVLIVGSLSYLQMPREQDPTINFNWIDISTVAPGMSAQDVETRVTDVIEEGIRKLSDIKFVQSSSYEGFSHILVRFNDVSERVFDKRISGLRREVQDKQRELPDIAETPYIYEVTTANAFPSATIIVTGLANDKNLQIEAERVKKDLARIKGVDKILDTALQQPELQVLFSPEKLQQLGMNPGQLADIVGLYYKDISAGSRRVGEESWLVRFERMPIDAQQLAKIPITNNNVDVSLGQIADIQPGWEKPQHYVLWQGQPAVMLAVTKQGSANTLKLVERIKTYIEQSQQQKQTAGVQLHLADDQTEITRTALNVMQTNAAIGLLLVLLVAWLFLGFQVAFLTAIAIPFVLAATFWVLHSQDESLNVMVLLGVVISLGMLVDDAVVVVESIYYRLQRGSAPMQAVVGGFKEVAAPVTTAVFTTLAAFLPLMLLPGIIGQFMRLVPFVVTIALLISLVEAFWILPSHILNAHISFSHLSRSQRWRIKFLRRLRQTYTKILIKFMRVPAIAILLAVLLFALTLFSALAGQINPSLNNNLIFSRMLVKTDFFASDPLRLFYLNVEMANSTPLEVTLQQMQRLQAVVNQEIESKQLRSVVAYAGQMFTETEAKQGAQYGQLLISLPPNSPGLHSVDQVIDQLRPLVENLAEPKKIYFIRLAGGPPTAKAISIKIRGDDFTAIREGVETIKQWLLDAPWAKDVSDDDSPGFNELSLQVNQEALKRSGINLVSVLRSIRLLVDGEIIAKIREQGESIHVRVKAMEMDSTASSILRVLDFQLQSPHGSKVPLSQLLINQTQVGQNRINHYNFRRSITLEADIDKKMIDVPQANEYIQDKWSNNKNLHPQLDLDYTGQLDDLNESLNSIFRLMLFGLLLMYAILGTQFKSYFEPMMILMTVPMAFTGVVVGLLVTQNPLSLFTLYGVVALAGIAVNAAIVLIATANNRLGQGMGVVHASIYAARRRVVPILITSLTTVAGLFSLAVGLGGKSLLWGPVATAIVWGLTVSTILTLILVPIMYRIFMVRGRLVKARSSKLQS